MTEINLDKDPFPFKNGFRKDIYPIIRRIFPELITNDLVGVQPMGYKKTFADLWNKFLHKKKYPQHYIKLSDQKLEKIRKGIK
jgi:hypothetical protein